MTALTREQVEAMLLPGLENSAARYGHSYDLARALIAAWDALELIAGRKGPYSMPFPESQDGYGSFAVVRAREALGGDTP